LIRDADVAEFIMASGKPASKGRTYERTVLRRLKIRAKPLADRAVPHMSQSQFSMEILGQLSAEIDRPNNNRDEICRWLAEMTGF
jgi:hypothetical protein